MTPVANGGTKEKKSEILIEMNEINLRQTHLKFLTYFYVFGKEVACCLRRIFGLRKYEVTGRMEETA